ncbi:MAG: TonB-dependent receptor domain-containing protein [Nitrospiraceae bacterium]
MKQAFIACGYFVSMCLVLCPPVVLAQTETAGVNGFVEDPTGAFIPGADVTAVNVATNATYRALTNESGYYVITPLPIGTYRITVEMPGFKVGVAENITLQVQQRAKIDFTLEIGEVTEQVTVESSTPLLETEDTSMGQVVNNRAIIELPLNGRNYLQLGTLAAGMMPVKKGMFNDHDSAFLANGLRYTMNNYLLDGVDNNSQITNLQSGGAEIIRPSVDAIQEFKIQTSNFSAEFGRSAGAVVNVAIKGGNNEFHGSLFEFHRNSALDAKNFFDSPDDPIPPFKQNQFGATAGGPIIKDKTFFFSSYEAFIARKGLTKISTVPTASMRAGNFGNRNIFNPNSVRENAAGSGFVRDPYPDNVIPESHFDPVAQRVIALYPAPNLPGATSNFLFNPTLEEDRHQFDNRIDHRFSEKDQIFGRYSYRNRELIAPGTLPFPAIGSTSDRLSDQQFLSHQLAVNYTHTFSPTVISEVRYGFNKVEANLRPFDTTRRSEELGIKGVSTKEPVTGLSDFRPAGFAALGDSQFLPNFQGSQTHQFLAALSIIKGNHTVKLGGDIRYPESFFNTYQRERGLFQFNGVYTQNPQSRGGTGSSMADFLLGLANNGILSTEITGTLLHRAFQFYVLDDWKVTPKLTLNVGLRYELVSPFMEKDDRQANFILEPSDSAFGTLLPAGTRGDGWEGRGRFKVDKNNVAPRLGLAYEITDKTVLRSAFGIFYTHNELWGVVNRMVSAFPFHVNVAFPTDQINPNLVVRDGYPADALSLDSPPRNPRRVSFVQDFPAGYTQQWNLNIQRQLPHDILLEVGYIGNSSVKLASPRNSNQAVPGPGPPAPRRRLPNQGHIQTYEVMGRSHYNSLQVSLEKRYSGGLQFLTSYTWGHAIEVVPQQTSGFLPRLQNNLDLSDESARSANDVRHRFTYAFTWDLPFGANRKWASQGIGASLLGGWQLTGVTIMRTGLPFTVGLGFDNANVGNAPHNARPNRIASGELPSSERSVDRWFDMTAFEAPPAFVFGSSGRNILDGPGSVNFDLGVTRTFDFTEQMKLQFRAEFFNAFNTPQFDHPGGGSIVSATRPMLTRGAGAKIRRTISDNRQSLVGLKLVG